MPRADVEVLVGSWGYTNPREAVRWWRRRGFLQPRAVVGGVPWFAFRDVVEAEFTARSNRADGPVGERARARAMTRFLETLTAEVSPDSAQGVGVDTPGGLR